ncbi:MAG: hypothetical protein BWK77_08725 [Verrucomicrobia bacterium A1]|nr:MAG: hypothetical protein BWK77_08725 [Verrucomicrobia bacterium A1]
MKMTTAADVMTTNVITVRKDELLTQVIALLLRWHISGLPVVDDDGTLAGIISEHDVMNMAFGGNAADTRVEEAMSTKVISFPPDASLADLVQSFSSRRLRRVPIVENGKLVGIVSRRDILREMLRRYERY